MELLLCLFVLIVGFCSIDQMRAANSGTDSKSGFLGEETLGKAVGCEGMAANGQDSNKNI